VKRLLMGVAPIAAGPTHPVWMGIAPFFVPSEFKHPFKMDVTFLRSLYRVRLRAGVPLRIVSDYRPPDRNASVGGAKASAHMELPCSAVDLRVNNNHERMLIVAAAIEEGFTRMGIYPAGEGGAGSLHLDASRTLPSPRIWTRV